MANVRYRMALDETTDAELEPSAPGAQTPPRPQASNAAPDPRLAQGPGARGPRAPQPEPPTPELPIEPESPALDEDTADPSAATTFAVNGRVLSKETGEPLAPDLPLVVYAVPTGPLADDAWEDLLAQDASGPAAILDRGGDANSPLFVVTSVGREVQFENRDQICHSYFSSSEPNTFEPEILDPGETRTIDLWHEGPVEVYCSLHTGKQMSLFVSPTPFHVQPQADGSFTLENLPAGEYEIRAWAEGLHPSGIPVQLGGAPLTPLELLLGPEEIEGAE